MLKTNNDEVMRVGEVAKDLHNFGGPCCWECRYCIMIRGSSYKCFKHGQMFLCPFYNVCDDYIFGELE